MRIRFAAAASIGLLAAFVAACGGGGGGNSTATAPAPMLTAPPSASASVITGALAQSATLSQIASGYSAGLVIPPTIGGTQTSIALTLQAAVPTGIPVPQGIQRSPVSIGVTLNPLVYVLLTPSATIAFQSMPTFTFALPFATVPATGSSAYVGFYDPALGQWQTELGPGTLNGQNILFGTISHVMQTLTAGTTYAFALFSSSQATPLSSPSPTPHCTVPPGELLQVVYPQNGSLDVAPQQGIVVAVAPSPLPTNWFFYATSVYGNTFPATLGLLTPVSAQVNSTPLPAPSDTPLFAHPTYESASIGTFATATTYTIYLANPSCYPGIAENSFVTSPLNVLAPTPSPTAVATFTIIL